MTHRIVDHRFQHFSGNQSIFENYVEAGSRVAGARSIWQIRNRMFLPAQEDLQNPRFVRIRKLLETLEFQEPH